MGLRPCTRVGWSDARGRRDACAGSVACSRSASARHDAIGTILRDTRILESELGSESGRVVPIQQTMVYIRLAKLRAYSMDLRLGPEGVALSTDLAPSVVEYFGLWHRGVDGVRGRRQRFIYLMRQRSRGSTFTGASGLLLRNRFLQLGLDRSSFDQRQSIARCRLLRAHASARRV